MHRKKCVTLKVKDDKANLLSNKDLNFELIIRYHITMQNIVTIHDECDNKDEWRIKLFNQHEYLKYCTKNIKTND